MSERLLEDFAQIASDWFWEMDAELRFTYFSERAAEFGIDPGRMIGRSRLDIAGNAQDAAFWQSHLDDLRARRPFRDFAYPFRHADGRLRWIKTTGQPRFSAQGVFMGYRGVGSDITAERETQERLARAHRELRETNARLEAQNRRFDTALGKMGHGLTMFDGEERLIVCNASYIAMYGMSPEVVKPGITIQELIHHRIAVGTYAWNADPDRALAEFRTLVGSRQRTAYHRVLGDGRVIAITHEPMTEGGFVATHEDITEREARHDTLLRQEEALRTQNLRFDAALNNMAQGLLMLDHELRLIVCNSRCLEIMGLSAEQMRPGVTLREIVALRVAAGRHPGCTVDEVYAQRAPILARGEPATLTTSYDNETTIQVAYRPMSDGGWVLTYEDVTERELHLETLRRQEEELRTQNLRFDAALNNMAQGLMMLDREGRLIVCNDRYLDLMGLSPTVVKPGATLREIIEHGAALGYRPTSTAQEVLDTRMALFARGEPAVLHTSFKDGRTIQTTYSPMADGGWVATYEDVTERELHLRTLQRQEEEMRTQNLRFDAALNNMSHGLCMFDGERRLIVCNRRYAEMYRLPPELTQPGVTYDELLQHRLSAGMYPRSGPESYVAGLTAALDEARPTNAMIELQDGRILSIAYQPMATGGWVAIHEDVTQRKQAEIRIEHMARHDALTDLANRTQFREKTEAALVQMGRRGALSVHCIDLDQFKGVNDTLGHPAGDALLCAVAERLRGCVRDGDTVARLGGDEFAVLQLGMQRPEEASALARRIIEAASRPYEIEGQQVTIGASIGIAVAPGDGAHPDQLLKHADLALYRAKADGRGTFRFFEPEMDSRLRARRALELDLRRALAQDEFELFYQPLVDLRTDRISGCEALLRWHHPVRGLVPPAEFIGLAEEIGVIVPLGEWVLRQACIEAARWPREMKVAVNLSPAQFKSSNLVNAVIRALAVSGLLATRLELEITETVLLLENEATLATLHQLRRLGVRISMDDFGTGYSSLSYLRSFPFDKIKIDRSFVQDLAEKQDAAAIIRAVAGLGSSLGMTTTAEGVETQAQLEQVRAEGCTEVQGFLFSRPRRAADLAALFADMGALARERGRTAA